MSTPDSALPTEGRTGSVKTLAIRLEPNIHAELALVAQLRNSTISDEIREAIATHVARIKENPELANRADAVLAAIDREASTRREAIASLFGEKGPNSTTAAATSRTRGNRKTTGDSA